jgi:hypothetical protein
MPFLLVGLVSCRAALPALSLDGPWPAPVAANTPLRGFSCVKLEGRGTTFTVRIPRGHEHLPAERLGAARSLASTSPGATAFVEESLHWSAPAPAEPQTAPAGERLESRATPRGVPRERILLADDNADMRDYLVRLLSERWDVEIAGEGEAALRSMRAAPPDLEEAARTRLYGHFMQAPFPIVCQCRP